MFKYILSLSLLFNSIAYAATGIPVVECDKPVTAVQGGKPIFPDCDGYFFTDAAEKEAAAAREDAAHLQKVNDELVKKSSAQAEENEILERRLGLYMQQADVLSKDVARRDNNENLYRILYFGLGALVTGYIASNVTK